MPTEKQSAASRANSQKSTGPRTAEGKTASRFNALKHGIYAESQIVFTESAEDLAELAAEYHEHYNPANPSERCLVDALIETEWRQRRMRRVEAGMWEDKRSSLLRYKTITEDDPSQRVVTPGEVFCNDDAKFTSLQRVVSGCHRDYRGVLKELTRLQRATASATDIPVCPPTAPEPKQTTTTSESSASFRQNAHVAPEPARPSPQTPANLVAEPAPASSLPVDRDRKLPEAA